MKKLLVLLLVSILLAGCGSAKKVVCTSDQDIDGVSAKVTVTAEFENDKVSKISAGMKFDDKDKAKEYCDLYNTLNTLAENEEDKVNVTCSDDTLSFDDYSSLVDDDNSVIGLTKDEFIKEMEKEDSVTCK